MLRRLFLFAAAGLVLAGVLYQSQRVKEPFKVSGFIEADEIRVGSRVGGRVLRVQAQEGQLVHAGEILVELEPFDLFEQRAQAQAKLAACQAEYNRLVAGFRTEETAQAKARRDQLAARLDKLVSGPRKQEIAAAQAQLELAEAQLELAQLNHQRTDSLLKQGTVTQEEMDKASTELKMAQATVQVEREELAKLLEGTRREEIDEAKAQLEEAHQAWQMHLHGYRDEEIAQAKAALEAAEAALRIIDRQVEELTIKAPVDGIVEAVELQAGDLVAPNAPAISLMDTSRLWVRAYVPENRLNVQVGQRVLITVDSFPGERFAGHISFVARGAEFTPGNVQTPEERSKQVFRIKVELDEALDRLRPGMAADVWLEPEKEPR